MKGGKVFRHVDSIKNACFRCDFKVWHIYWCLLAFSLHSSSMMGQPSNPLRQQDSDPAMNFRQNKYQAPRGGESGQSQPAAHTGLSQMGQKASHGARGSTQEYSQQSRALPPPVSPPRRPSANAAQPQKNPWKFTNSFETLRSSFEGKRSSNPQQTVRPTPTQVEMYIKKKQYIYDQ